MSPETTIVDSGAIVKAEIFWNWVIFRETRFFYSLNGESYRMPREAACLSDDG